MLSLAVPGASEAELDDLAVVVAVVEVVDPAVFSALVSVGGVMSGVLLGMTSELVELPPQAASTAPAASTAVAERTARVLNGLTGAARAGPCAAGTWDTR